MKVSPKLVLSRWKSGVVQIEDSGGTVGLPGPKGGVVGGP